MDHSGPFLIGASLADSLRTWRVFLTGSSSGGRLEARYVGDHSSRLTVTVEPVSFRAMPSRARARLEPGVQAALAVRGISSEEVLEAFEDLQSVLLSDTIELVRLSGEHTEIGRTREACNASAVPSPRRRRR